MSITAIFTASSNEIIVSTVDVLVEIGRDRVSLVKDIIEGSLRESVLGLGSENGASY